MSFAMDCTGEWNVDTTCAAWEGLLAHVDLSVSSQTADTGISIW
jgi:hypothetical protein